MEARAHQDGNPDQSAGAEGQANIGWVGRAATRVDGPGKAEEATRQIGKQHATHTEDSRSKQAQARGSASTKGPDGTLSRTTTEWAPRSGQKPATARQQVDKRAKVDNRWTKPLGKHRGKEGRSEGAQDHYHTGPNDGTTEGWGGRYGQPGRQQHGNPDKRSAGQKGGRKDR